MPDFRERLERFLADAGQPLLISQLTPDASTREYYRVSWHEEPAIACVYPEAFAPAEQTYLDVTNLFLVSGLPVARIYDFDGALGVIVMEDFGDRILRPILDESKPADRDQLVDEAISLIAAIQASTGKAFEIDSVASRLKFDVEKLNWELNFFMTHYFETYRQTPLSRAEELVLEQEFLELSAELETHAEVLCHRDFHAFNLMLDPEARMRIIDHQDARIGSVAYDLVSLLLDRVLETPDSLWLRQKQDYFLAERERLGLTALNFDEFAYRFRLQTVQRCLKAIGTFSFQSVNRGKTYFIQYIEPMFRITLQTVENLDRFPNLRKIIEKQIS